MKEQPKKKKSERKKPGEPLQALNWAFSYFWDTQEDIEKVKAWALLEPRPYVRIFFGKEICPKTGSPHLQGYICFSRKVTRFRVQTLFGTQLNCKPCYAAVWQNQKYCSKDKDIYFDGIPLEDCPENDHLLKGDDKAELLLRLAEAGEWDILRKEHPAAYLYQKGQLVRAFNDALKAPQEIDGILDGWWICGEAGSGKDQYAKTKLGETFYTKCGSNKYWDGYAGQTTVWMRDIGRTLAGFQDSFKDWTDRYKFAAEVKHSTMHIRPTRIVCTSQYMPSDLGLDDETVDAIHRRFQIVHINQYNEAEVYERENVDRPPPPVEKKMVGPPPRSFKKPRAT